MIKWGCFSQKSRHKALLCILPRDDNEPDFPAEVANNIDYAALTVNYYYRAVDDKQKPTMAEVKQQSAWLFYSKRMGVLLLLGALYWGFTLYRNYQRESELSQMRSKAELVAKLGVSDAIHDDSDSLRESKRDSILDAAGESAESLDEYIHGFEGSEDKLAIFWTMIDSVGDSLVKAEFARIRANDPKKDSSATQR